MITFTGIVFSAVFVAAQIQTSSYSPAARRAAAPRPGRDRRPRAADRHRDLLAVRARGDRPPDRPSRAATSLPAVDGALRAAARADHARRVRGARAARVREHADRRHPARADAARLRGDRGRPSARRAATPMPPRRRLADVDATEITAPGAARRHRGRRPRGAAAPRATRPAASSSVVPAVGEYLAPGRLVLRITRRADATPDPTLARRVFVLARQRTIDQDPAFALRMLVDIAIRGALARDQRSDDGRAGARPDRGAARRARAAPPGPVGRRRRRRSPARDRPRARAGRRTWSSG